jgi:flavin-dependent dehydrogenase
MTDFDMVVVGASIAGCTAARLHAQRGACVALVEKRPDLDAYKTVCTHYIQPSATPTIEKLGLPSLIEERGAVRNPIDFSSPYGGWIRSRGDRTYGYNITRRLARSVAAPHDRRDLGCRGVNSSFTTPSPRSP